MNAPNFKTEQGQAVVLLVIAMIVLLGFTALAVDGSMVYSDRRFAQSGSDASSLAGGAEAIQSLNNSGVTWQNWNTNANCTTGNVYNSGATTAAKVAAINRAASNDFTITSFNDIASLTIAKHGVATECGEEPVYANTSGGGQYLLTMDKFMDIYTMITQDTQTAFIHFVYGGPAKNTVTTVTRIHPRHPLAYGYAIIALNKDHCSGNKNGIQLRGSQNTRVEGGGIFSNGCMDVDGNNTTTIQNASAAYFFPGNSLDHIHFVDSSNNPIPGMIAEQLQDDDAYRIPQEAYDIPVPDCTGHIVQESDLVGQSNLTGLYCVDGAFNINSTSTMKGINVTLVFLGGKVTINGGADLQLFAPQEGYSGSAIPGVVIYMPKEYYGPPCGEVNQEIKINGGSGSRFRGSIIAPCADISIEGGTDVDAFHSQIIGYNVNIGGNADTKVVYQSNEQASLPSYLDLYR